MKWHAVATWKWDMPEDEVCGICRVQFDGTCPTCKYPGDDCPLRESRPSHTSQVLIVVAVIGKCAHSFHMVGHCQHPPNSCTGTDVLAGQHCLLTWIQQDSSKGLCPMCRQSRWFTVPYLLWKQDINSRQNSNGRMAASKLGFAQHNRCDGVQTCEKERGGWQT